MSVKLVWAGGVDQIAFLARVSNPSATPDMPSEKLIRFLIRNKHWSPFEMASMCVEIHTTRDIGRQILRHRSFSFQEFSQRYAEVQAITAMREARLKGSTNRQGSLEDRDGVAEKHMMQTALICFKGYEAMIQNGVAPECARAILPEGFTPTKMYMTGTIRSWIHYIQERTAPNVQKEHRLIAQEIKTIFASLDEALFKAVFENEM